MECQVSDLSIHYESIGRGMPVLLIHGYHVDHRLMSGCLEPVFQDVQGYERIYIDLPGMGQTKSAAWVCNSDVMLDIVLEFITKVIPKGRFLLAGESYGGYLARGILHRIPDRVAGFYLLCPMIIADHHLRTLPEHKVLKTDAALLAQLDPALAAEFADVHVIQTGATWERFQDEVLTGLKLADDPFLAWFREKGYAFSFDVDRLDRPFPGPSLILLGRQDASVGYRDAWDILENYPRASFAVLDRSGHNLQIEQAKLHRCLVLEWLDRVKEAEALAI